ncbi:hypothetical protein WMY93_014466 [Mugilogobius chulae]|uniref:Prolactin receptor n=1 Tax=Mugilogobius chulae TaxID=88201 RepID=A0AAW0NV13_9GOBI
MAGSKVAVQTVLAADSNPKPPAPFRRVTFSVVSQPQDPHQQGSLQSCYDSGLDESETPSSKSSSGPRLGALPLPEDSYERTTPDGSVGEAEHMENDTRPLPDVAMTGKCTRECDEYGHSDSCWMPVHTSPERRPSKSSNNPQQPKLSTFMSGTGSSSSSSAEQPGSQETLAMAAMANGDPNAAHMMGDRNRNLLNRKWPPLHPTKPSARLPTALLVPGKKCWATPPRRFLWLPQGSTSPQRVVLSHDGRYICEPSTGHTCCATVLFSKNLKHSCQPPS